MKGFAFIVLAALFFIISCDQGKRHKTPLDNQTTMTADSTDIYLTDTTSTVDEKEFAENTDDTFIPLNADELFDDFFFNFVSNSKLQKSRIVFPLEISTKDNSYKMEKSDWRMDVFFTEQDYYTLIFDNEMHMEMGKNTSVDSVIVEKIDLAESSIKNYIFSRKNKLWMLNAIRTTDLSQNANADFLEFYRKFASDKDFQNRCLCESVQFITTDSDDDFSTVEGVITSESWPAFAPELPTDIIYNVIYSPTTPGNPTKIFLLRGISNGLEVELYFIREQNRWKLAKLTT